MHNVLAVTDGDPRIRLLGVPADGDVVGVEIPTIEGKVHLATVMDLFSRRIVGFAGSNSYPIAALAQAAAESFFSTLTHELIRRRDWKTRRQARRDIARWITDRYNTRRLPSTPDTTSPTDYEQADTD